MLPWRKLNAWTLLSMYVSQFKHTSLHRDPVLWRVLWGCVNWEFLRSLNVQTLESSVWGHAPIWEHYRFNHFNHHDVIPHNCCKTNFFSRHLWLLATIFMNAPFKWLKLWILYRLLWHTQFLVKFVFLF